MPTAPSTLRPTLPPGLVLAKADLSIKCGSTDLGNYLMVSGDSIYVDCPDYGVGYGAILVVDPTAGRVAKTLNLSHFADLKAVDHGIWVDFGRACTQPGGCAEYMERLDPATGRVTFHLDRKAIAAAGLGYIWMYAPAGTITRTDVTTLATTTIPFAYSYAAVACGSLFGVDGGGYHRLDPATGTLLTDIADSKGVSGLTDVNGQCWGVVADDGQGRAQFVRMGQTAVEYRGPWIAGPKYAPTLQIIGDGFWLIGSVDYDHDRLQQVDPTTGRSLGTAWAVPGSASLVEIVAAGGRIWRMEEGPSYALQRLNISSDPLATPPAP